MHHQGVNRSLGGIRHGGDFCRSNHAAAIRAAGGVRIVVEAGYVAVRNQEEGTAAVVAIGDGGFEFVEMAAASCGEAELPGAEGNLIQIGIRLGGKLGQSGGDIGVETLADHTQGR